MTTSLVPANTRPTLAEVIATDPTAGGELPEAFVDVYVEIRAREPAEADGADERARDEARTELYEHHLFAALPDEALPEIPDDVLGGWLANEPELLFRIARERLARQMDDKVKTFAELRASGKTVVQIARKMGDEPGALVRLVRHRMDATDAERLMHARRARAEDEARRGYDGRRRLLSALAGKLSKELDRRDLSAVPTDKLVTMLLRISELSRETAPEGSVEVQFKTI